MIPRRLLMSAAGIGIAVVLVPIAATTSVTAAAGTSYRQAVSEPRTDPYYPRPGTTTLDALHYGLDLTWDDAARQLSGVESLTFRATSDESSVVLDFGAPLTVDAVEVDGADATATHDGDTLTVATGALTQDSRHTLTLTYHGEPAAVPAPTVRRDVPTGGWVTLKDGQTWTLQEPFGAFTWYAVNDHPSDKAFYDVTVHTRSDWRGVSNGELMSNTVTGEQRTMQWHLASPAASYLITLDIGPYRLHQQAGPHGLPLTFWVRPHDKGVLRVLHETPVMLRWLEHRLGPYPFDRLGAVVAPNHSAEETQTMVSITPSILRKQYFGVDDLLHEYSHQWYGDEVTPNSWTDVWLNESFAEYIQFRWEISKEGVRPKYVWPYLARHDQRFRDKDGPPGDYKRHRFESSNVYLCGALMLDRLHAKIGNRRFWTVLRDWPRTHRFGNVDRGDWIAYVDRRTGHNYGPFIRRWLTSRTSPA